MTYYLCASTRDLNHGITRLFDFIWPTASAFWNLRWQMNGYLLVRPNASDHELKSKFVLGSDVWGANVRRACVDHSWDQYKEELARIVLITAIASFERWTKDFASELQLPAGLDKALQFPTSPDGGVGSVLDLFRTNPCAELAGTLYPAIILQGKYSLMQIEALMRCYRYFKELRNCLMHSGSQPNQRTVNTWLAFQPVATASALGMSEVPAHTAVVLGDPVRLSLRGVVGFCEVLLRVATTLDYEACRSVNGEVAFVKKWKSHIPHKKTLKGDQAAAEKQISSLVNRRLQLPVPHNAYEIRPLLIRHRLAV